jgi:hypothetical protein
MARYLLLFDSYGLVFVGKRALGRPSDRWLDNMKMVLRGCYGMLWIGLIWLRIETSGGLL